MVVHSGIDKYLSLIKFSHTVFAMPFAIIGFFMGVNTGGVHSIYKTLILIVLCMVFARNAAMAFNRFVDRHIDLLNPRTKSRELPAQIIKPNAVILFIIINVVLFMATAFFINKMTFILAPLALFIVMGYSYTKRFTLLSHFVLGLSLAIAPIGAYIAMTESIDLPVLFMGAAVLFWVSGFDILYALQDITFDKSYNLKSIPVRFGFDTARLIAATTHIVSTTFIVLSGLSLAAGYVFWFGAAIFIFFLSYQHIAVYRHGLEKINLVFFTFNGVASAIFAAFTCIELYFF